MSDAVRISLNLRVAVQAGTWNPTDWGKRLLANVEGALRIATDTADETACKDAMIGVLLGDLVVHITGEIADGLIPAAVLEAPKPITAEAPRAPARILRLAA